jgi:hypothetical protein
VADEAVAEEFALHLGVILDVAEPVNDFETPAS